MMKTSIFAFLLVLALSSSAKPQLTGDTSRPVNSVFPIGEQVKLTFRVSGLKPGEKTVLKLNIVDELEKSRQKKDIPVEANEKGEWSGMVDGPCGKLGFYRVRAKLKDGTPLAKLMSRDAGFLTYAVVPGEKKYKLYPMDQTFFGYMGPSLGAWEKEIGLRWCENIGIPWPYRKGSGEKAKLERGGHPAEYLKDPEAWKLDHSPDYNDWKHYHVNTGHNHCRIYKWMTDQYFEHIPGMKLAGKSMIRFTPEGARLIADYFAKYAENYEKHLKQPYGMIQYTWEPHYAWGFGGTAQDLVDIHKVIYEGIHRNSTRIKLVGPCAAGLNLPWHEELFKCGLLKYVDAISIHPYFSSPPEPNDLVGVIRKFKAMIRKYAGRDLEIYAVEQGKSALGKNGEIEQARHLLRCSLIMLGEGFKCDMKFYTHDYYNGKPGYMYNLDPKRQWNPVKVGPKPLLPMLGGASLLLNGHTSAGAIEYLGSTVWGYAYQRQDGFTTLALWDFSGQPREVEIPVGRKELLIGDVMGNTRKAVSRNGLLKLTLTEDPCYVIDVDPKLWGRNAVKVFVFDKKDLEAVAGDTIEVSGTLHGPEGGLNGILVLTPDKHSGLPVQKKTVKLAAGKAAPFRFKIKIPENAAEGSLPISLKYLENGNARFAGGVLCQIRNAVAIPMVRPAFRNDKLQLDFTVENLTAKTIGGKLGTRLKGNPDGRASASFQLAPHEKRLISLSYPELDFNPLEWQKFEVQITPDRGRDFTVMEKISALKVKPAENAAAVKAEYELPESGLFDPFKSWDGPKDHAAKIGFGWNRQFLLMKIEVQDNIHVQQMIPNEMWQNDCVQLTFSKSYRYKLTSNGFEDQMNIAQIRLNYALHEKQGESCYVGKTFQTSVLPIGMISVKEAPFSIRKTPSGNGVKTEYLIALPWKYLGLVKPPQANDLITWGININDFDGDRQGRQLSRLTAFSLEKHLEFGTLVLCE